MLLNMSITSSGIALGPGKKLRTRPSEAILQVLLKVLLMPVCLTMGVVFKNLANLSM